MERKNGLIGRQRETLMNMHFDILRFFSQLKSGKSLALLLAAVLSISSVNVGLALDDYAAAEYAAQRGKAKMEQLSEENMAVAEFYKDKEKVELNSEIESKLKSIDNSDAKDALKLLQTLSNFTGTSGSKAFNKRGAFNYQDARAENTLQDLKEKLTNLRTNGEITADEQMAILDYAKNNLYAVGAERAEEFAKQQGDISRVEDIKEANQSVAEDFDNCPTVDQIRAKYTSGCWSCLVVEKITSAFMTAASKAYSLSQKAGLILLGLGAVMWLLMWGLRNVSSLTQLEPGNILNELLKFAFKIALAYVFITSGLPMVGKYFINPIMGVGAKIAENFWDQDKIKPYTEEFDWDLTDEQYKEISDYGVTTPVVQEVPVVKQEITEEDKAALDLAKQAGKNFAEENIPNFIIPPVFEGHLTSPVGCRFHPVHKTYRNHKGLDIGTSGKKGGKVVASGPGKVMYNYQKGGAGNYAKIDHGKGWVTNYFHMLPESAKLHPNGSQVEQGQVIGFVGSTGASTGAHLHFEIIKGGHHIDPLYLLKGEIRYVDGACNASSIAQFPAGFKHGQNVPTSPESAWTAASRAVVNLTNIATGVSVSSGYTPLTTPTIGDIKYTGPTDIMSKAVMNSILGATKAIGDITSENMVLGDAIMCYATLDKGGAWHAWRFTITNFWMWIEGAFIWCTGMLLTVAIAYYLLDISFKIGFAVVALPIVVGLWPFDLTRDKFGVCVGIIAKSAAIFAFLAITTSFTVLLTDAVYSYDDDNSAEQTTDSNAPKGLAKLYKIMDTASLADAGALADGNTQVDMEYASDKLAIFSTTFVLILFAFLYSYKLIKSTVPELANKFFPDKAFGDQQPMHHLATAATKAVKDIAMKPAGWARDVATYQGSRLAHGAVNGAVGKVIGRTQDFLGKGDGKSKTLAGRTARGAGNVAKAAGEVGAAAGKGIQAVGKAAQGLNAVVPGLGSVVGGTLQAAGKGVEAVGKVAEKAGQAVKKAGNATDKAYNKFATRNQPKEDAGAKPEDKGKQDGGEK